MALAQRVVLLSDQAKSDLKFLKRVDADTLTAFCELAVRFATRGFDAAAFKAAAQRFGLAAEPLRRALDALAHLFGEATKLALTEPEFGVSLDLVGHGSATVNDVLKQYYAAHGAALRAVLGELRGDDVHHFDALEWRLDVELATRSSHARAKPVVLLKFDTRNNQQGRRSHLVEADPVELRHLADELQAALNELKTGNVRRVMRNV
mmetsp:Transcript_24856/g.60521  ORF Transcript_24856/g.60521 Transcript_24856/m.60521 type:complete len:207 (+) Transcript_24856:60-680(+)